MGSYEKKSFLQGLACGLCGRGVETRELVAYLYNGVRLPALPEWDRETYPYATIHKVSTIEKLSVTLTLRKTLESVPEGISDGTYEALVTNVGDITYQITQTGYYPTVEDIIATDWGEAVISTSRTTSRTTGLIWTNTDIISIGSYYHAAGEVILAASNPVAVYE